MKLFLTLSLLLTTCLSVTASAEQIVYSNQNDCYVTTSMGPDMVTLRAYRLKKEGQLVGYFELAINGQNLIIASSADVNQNDPYYRESNMTPSLAYASVSQMLSQDCRIRTDKQWANLSHSVTVAKAFVAGKATESFAKGDLLSIGVKSLPH